MLRDFLEAGGRVEWHALTDEKADATFTHPQTGEVRIDWDMKRATVAGLAGRTTTGSSRARCCAAGWCRRASAHSGRWQRRGIYVPEETADFAGTTLEHADEPEPDERDALNEAIPMTKQVPLNKAAAAGTAPRPQGGGED